MRLLLDTHALLWALSRPRTLTSAARAALEDGRNFVAVSAASVWEVGIKRALGKVEAPGNIAAAITATRFQPLAVTVEHAEAAGGLPLHHRDPFDRMLVAQALLEGLTIVTRDPRISRYGVPVLAA